MPDLTTPLQIRDYRLLLMTRLCSVVATLGMVVVIGWQVYDVARADYGMSPSQAAFQLGLLGAFQFVPLFLLTPVAGWTADRFDRRKQAALAGGIDVFIALILALATYRGALTLPLLFTMAALHGMARVFAGPALTSIAPNIVPPDLLPKAIGISSAGFSVGGMVGPALGGLLYAVNPVLPYAMAVIMITVGAIGVMSIKPLPRIDREPRHPVREMQDGLKFVVHDRFLLGCVTLDLFAVLLAGATALLPVFARDILHVGPEGLGQMRAAPSIGAGLVAAWMSWRPMSRNVGAKMLWAVVIFGFATAAFGLSRNFYLSLFLLAFLGAADMISVFIRNSLVQLNTPDTMRGRVSSIAGLAVSASNELGELQSGIAAALLGATGAVVFGGIGAVVITAVWSVLFPQLRLAKSFKPMDRITPGPLAQAGEAVKENA